MALELNGTTGVSLVQDGVVTAADLASGAAASNLGTGNVTASMLASTLDLTGKTVTLPAGTGGKVLQVQQYVLTATAGSTSTTYADFLTVAITPSSTSSKVLVQAYFGGSARSGWNNLGVRLVRGSTPLLIGDAAGSRQQQSWTQRGFDDNNMTFGTLIYLDSPSTTSSTQYKVQLKVNNSNPGSGVYINRSYTDNDSADIARTASSIVVMEISA